MSRKPPDLPSVDELRSVVAELVLETPLRLVVLFGSVARGDAGAADVDIGVLGTGPTDMIALTNRLTRRLRTQQIDLADLARADPLLMVLVARDGIVLHEAEPGEFAQFASLATRRFADTAKFREMEREVIADFLERSGHGA